MTSREAMRWSRTCLARGGTERAFLPALRPLPRLVPLPAAPRVALPPLILPGDARCLNARGPFGLSEPGEINGSRWLALGLAMSWKFGAKISLAKSSMSWSVNTPAAKETESGGRWQSKKKKKIWGIFSAS